MLKYQRLLQFQIPDSKFQIRLYSVFSQQSQSTEAKQKKRRRFGDHRQLHISRFSKGKSAAIGDIDIGITGLRTCRNTKDALEVISCSREKVKQKVL